MDEETVRAISADVLAAVEGAIRDANEDDRQQYFHKPSARLFKIC